MAVVVSIIGKFNDADIKRAQRELDTLGGNADKTSRTMGYLKGAMIGVGIAAGAAALKFGIDGVQAFIADEAAAAKLSQTLDNLGLAHDTARVEAMIDALQRQTGVADDELRPAFGRLVTSLGDTGKATDALQLAMDISAGTGKSLDTVVQSLGKAYDGNTAGLGRLGIGIDKAILKTGDMDVITAALSERFAGQSTTAAQTWQGQINRVSVAFDELKESFGGGFLSGLGSAETGVGDLTTTLKDMQPTMETIGSTIGQTVVNTLALTKGVIDAKASFDKWKVDAGAWGTFADALISSLGIMAGGVNTLKEAADAAYAALKRLQGQTVPGTVTYTGPENPSGGFTPNNPTYTSQVPAAARRANGGPVGSGMPYLVGEEGPELFVPGMSGSIVPNGNAGSALASSSHNTYQITVQAGVGDPRVIGEQVVEYVRKFEQANGRVWAAA